MKKLFLLVFALLLINPIVLTQWQTFNVTTSGRFYDVCVVSPGLIWASGDSAKVYRSTNGGQNWQNLNSGIPDLPVLQITAIDQNNAWINLGAKIFATTNGGTTWLEQFYSPVTFINKIHFFNQNTGYLLTDQQDSVVGFFVTRNAGLNWVRSNNSPVFSNSTNWISDNGANSLDTNFIWFVAEGAPGAYSRFYKLTGGLNNVWQSYIIGNSVQQCKYAAFKNSNTGIVTSLTQGILITTNSGVNWISQNSSSFSEVQRDILVVPGTDWVVQTGMGKIRLSYDLCNTWSFTTSASVLNFCDAKDTNSIWIAASNGRLLRYSITYIGMNQISSEVPDRFTLYQNYPNPFNPVTKIKFDIPKPGNISFRVYDVLGKIVYSINEYKDAGSYEIIFSGNDIASGIYYYSIEANGSSDVRKMVLLK